MKRYSILVAFLSSLLLLGNIGPLPGGSGGGGGGSGTVTSVALSDGSSTPIYTITGSPVTTSGTLRFTLSTETANKVFAGPSSGGAAQPTFRSLVAGDIPVLPYLSAVLSSGDMIVGDSGNAATAVTMTGDIKLFSTGATAYNGTVPVAKGGTGRTSLTANNVLLGNTTAGVQFVAPGTSGNVLTSNGTTWASAAPAGISGSGTTNALTKWSSSSAITSSYWNEGATNGELQFGKAATYGTAAAPLVDLKPATGAGLFTDSSGNLFLASQGKRITGNDASAFNIYDASDATKYMSFTATSGSNIVLQSIGVGQDLIYRTNNSSNAGHIRFQDSGGNQLFMVEADPATANVYRSDFLLNGQNSGNGARVLVWDGSGVGIGQRGDTLNALTVTQRADRSNIGGTSTANAATAIVGSNTTFTQDYGIGDLVSLSSAATTYATITAIADQTHMTVTPAIGNGTSQTLNKKQAMLRIEDASNVGAMMIDPLGRFMLASASNKVVGTAVCNGNTEVTVTNSNVTANTIILLTEQATGGTPLGVTYVSARTAGTSFGFKCAATDTSTVGYMLVEPFNY